MNFAALPAWQRCGVGLSWSAIEKVGRDPIRDREVVVRRRALVVHRELPMKRDYGLFVEGILHAAGVTRRPTTVGS